MVKRDARYPFIDRKLNTFRAFSLGVFIWWLVGAAFLWMGRPAVWAALCSGLGLVSVCCSLALPMGRLGWRLGEVVWGLTLVVLAALLIPAGWRALVLLVPLLAFLWMLRLHKVALARLSGLEPTRFAMPRSEVPTWAPCVRCGSRQSEVVAPLYVLSMVTLSFRWPGRFRPLCARHARLAAIPALICSLVLGPLGIPWGILWAFEAAQLNWEVGGVTLGSAVLADMRAREAAEGGADEPQHLADFALGLVCGGVVFIAAALRVFELLPA